MTSHPHAKSTHDMHMLLKALKGLVVMSAELEAMADSLYSNQVLRRSRDRAEVKP